LESTINYSDIRLKKMQFEQHTKRALRIIAKSKVMLNKYI